MTAKEDRLHSLCEKAFQSVELWVGMFDLRMGIGGLFPPDE